MNPYKSPEYIEPRDIAGMHYKVMWLCICSSVIHVALCLEYGQANVTEMIVYEIVAITISGYLAIYHHAQWERRLIGKTLDSKSG